MGKCASNEYWIRSGSLNIKSVDRYNSLKEGLNERLTTSPTKKLKMLKEDLEHFRDNVDRRRRLVEAAYYSFIGFNMLLMCGLLVGISFAYHIGTREANYEPIRW